MTFIIYGDGLETVIITTLNATATMRGKGEIAKSADRILNKVKNKKNINTLLLEELYALSKEKGWTLVAY